jgi:hypothetical protein
MSQSKPVRTRIEDLPPTVEDLSPDQLDRVIGGQTCNCTVQEGFSTCKATVTATNDCRVEPD